MEHLREIPSFSINIGFYVMYRTVDLTLTSMSNTNLFIYFKFLYIGEYKIVHAKAYGLVP